MVKPRRMTFTKRNHFLVARTKSIDWDGKMWPIELCWSDAQRYLKLPASTRKVTIKIGRDRFKGSRRVKFTRYGDDPAIYVNKTICLSVTARTWMWANFDNDPYGDFYIGVKVKREGE